MFLCPSYIFCYPRVPNVMADERTYLSHGICTDTVLYAGYSWQHLLGRNWRSPCHCSYSECSPLDWKLEDHTSQVSSPHSAAPLQLPYTDTGLQPGGVKCSGVLVTGSNGTVWHKKQKYILIQLQLLFPNDIFCHDKCNCHLSNKCVTWTHTVLLLTVPAVWHSQGWHTWTEVGSDCSSLKKPLIHSSQFLPEQEREEIDV